MDPDGGNFSGQDETRLKQRISELENRVAELEAELTGRPPLKREPVNWRSLYKPILFLVTALILAGLPAFFVVQSRWLGNRISEYHFQNDWCRIDFLCKSALPPYFILIIPGLAVLIVLFAFQKQSSLLPYASLSQVEGSQAESLDQLQVRIGRFCLWGGIAALIMLGLVALLTRKPPGGLFATAFLLYLIGWSILEIPFQHLKGSLRQNWIWLVSVCLIFTCLILLIASLYAVPEFQWIYVLLLFLVGVVQWMNRRKLHPILWIIALALFLYSFNTNAWWLSAIGDEYSFFVQARAILQEQSLSKISQQIFVGSVVNGTHPYLSSFIQAFFMWLFGINGFAWRFSNAFLCAVAVGLFYPFFKLLVPGRTALLAATFLAASHYIMSFGKIGYNNLQALFGMSMVLAATAWAIQSKRRLAFCMLGAALGLCFYLYPASLYIVPLPFLLFLFYYPPKSKTALLNWGLVLVSLMILVYPLLLQPGFWQTKLMGTFFNNPQLVQSLSGLFTHVTKNFAYAFFSFLYITSEGHFVAASYVDPLVGSLACLGLAYVISRLFRERAAGFLLISLFMLVLLVGATHDRDFPPNTRMFLLLPWWVLLASIGLSWLVESLRNLELPQPYLKGLVIGVIMVVIALNLYQANRLDRDRLAGLQELENLFLRIVQRAQNDEARFPKNYFFITDPTWTSEGIQLIIQTYPVEAHITDVVVTGGALPASIRELIEKNNSLVIIKPWLNPSLIAFYEQELRVLGKTPCDVRATNGDKRFVLWHSAETAYLCQ